MSRSFKLAKPHRQWNSETGYINKGMLAKCLSAAKSPTDCIVGLTGMVNALHGMVNESGVDDDASGTEDFSGY
jgi:Na+-transporting NADH:ubiquinone oxidoreductase subunit NqrF